MPIMDPFSRMEPIMYSEQLGEKRQQSPRYGEIARW